MRILKKALEYGPYAFEPSWFNNDDNFAKVMSETLYLQRALVNEVAKLKAASEKADLDLRGWKARGPARVMLLAGWVHARTSAESVAIDLRDCELTPDDGEQLARLMTMCSRLNAIDVRGNESMGERAVAALVDFMERSKVKSAANVPRSVCGVTPARSQLAVPKTMTTLDCKLTCAELEASFFSEGVSASMGGKSKGTVTLNRRGGAGGDSWQPLIWAAKDNNLMVAEMLLERGHDVNKQEPGTDKGLSKYSPLHWAAQKGQVKMVELLLSRGANPDLLDKHNNTAKALAEKKGETEVMALLDAAAATGGKKGGGGGAGGARKSASATTTSSTQRLSRPPADKVPATSALSAVADDPELTS